MVKRWRKKQREEINRTGGGDVERSELDQLMQDIDDDMAKTVLDQDDSASLDEKAKGEEVRNAALETMGESKKRHREAEDKTVPPRKMRKSAFDGLHYLEQRNNVMKEIEEKKIEIEKENLALRRKEADNVAAQNKMMTEQMSMQMQMMMNMQKDMFKMFMDKK